MKSIGRAIVLSVISCITSSRVKLFHGVIPDERDNVIIHSDVPGVTYAEMLAYIMASDKIDVGKIRISFTSADHLKKFITDVNTKNIFCYEFADVFGTKVTIPINCQSSQIVVNDLHLMIELTIKTPMLVGKDSYISVELPANSKMNFYFEEKVKDSEEIPNLGF